MIKEKKKCKAITHHNRPCPFNAVLCGYCMGHYKVLVMPYLD